MKEETKEGKKKVPRKKSPVLRFFLTFLVLLATGLAVFYLGWISFRLKEGEYALVHTKSHGYEQTVLQSGEFSWRWQALLPSNLSLHIFTLDTHTVRINQKGSLPSSEFYASLTDKKLQFDWNIEAIAQYQVAVDALLPVLMKQSNQDESDPPIRFVTIRRHSKEEVKEEKSELGIFYQDLADQIKSSIIETFLQESLKEMQEPLFRKNDALENNIQKIISRNKTLEMFRLDIMSSDFPDSVLYESSRQLYQEIMDQSEAIIAKMKEDSVVDFDERLDAKLLRLGEIKELLDGDPNSLFLKEYESIGKQLMEEIILDGPPLLRILESLEKENFRSEKPASAPVESL